MPALRDYLGTRCPTCRNDILQAAPSTNRMPSADLAWCPGCNARHSLEELQKGPKGGSLLGRLFSRPNRS